MSRNHESQSLRIATIKRGQRGHAKNVTMEWKELRDRLGKSAIDHDTPFAAYKKMTRDQQGRLKDVGAFCGGHFKDGVRQAGNISSRSILTLDIDDTTAQQIEFLKSGNSEIAQYEFFGSTTRSHCPEAPRWRLVFPLSRNVSSEEYAPLSRILASKVLETVKESMDAVDDVSYRVAQIMYWPSHCSDAEFDTLYNEGDLVDPDAVFEEFGDGWTDWSQLPYSEKRGQKRPTLSAKAENPTEKRGVVGAFCRSYDVPAAIKKFIPDVYLIGDKMGKKPRYTYTAGSGANGAIVEDDGLFLYSHHGTDPCGERLVNAFDMVRLHLFGAADKGVSDDVTAINMPSYKEFQQFLTEDDRTTAEMRKDQYDMEAIFDDVEDDGSETVATEPDLEDEFEDLIGDSSSKPAKLKPDAEWLTTLEADQNGFIKGTLTNLATILQNDPRLKGAVEFNDFTQEPVSREQIKSTMAIIPKSPILDLVNGDIWTDRHDYCVRALIEAPHGKGKAGYGLKVTDRDLKGAVDLAAAKRTFHPVRDYLKRTKWDGTKRIDHLFVKYLGAKSTPYTRGIARLMFLGAVTRVFEPGHKFDYVVILEGIQGKRKSTFISTLARNWFVEMEGDLHDRKQLVEKMQGAWILEIPELSGFGKAEIQAIKAVFSASHDKVRLAYDKRGKKFMRQCIFIGSTNDAEYLRDPTGGRRFWPIACEDMDGEIDIESLELEIDQMWAEAYAVYLQMRVEKPKGLLPLYLSNAEAAAEALELQESRRVESVEDGYAGVIDKWLNKPVIDNEFEDVDDMAASETKEYRRNHVCLMQLWVEGLGRTRDQYTEGMARTLGKAMKLISSWELIGPRNTRNFGKQKVYKRKGSDGSEFTLITSASKDDLDDLGI